MDPQHTAELMKPSRSQRTMIVTGYGTSLPEIDLQIGMTKYFTSCGEVVDILVHNSGRPIPPSRTARVAIRGEGAVERAMKLSGRDVGGWNITVVRVMAHLKHDFPTSNRAPPSFLRFVNRRKTTLKQKNKNTTE